MRRTSSLLINEEPLQLLPSLAKAVGLNEAIVIQQLHYWLQKSDHEHDGRRWIYNTVEGWQKQFPFWSEKTIRRIFDSLVDMKIVVKTDAYNKSKIDRTLWYSLDYEALYDYEFGMDKLTTPHGQLDQLLEVDNLTNSNQRENTTEITEAGDNPALPALQMHWGFMGGAIEAETYVELYEQYGADEFEQGLIAVKNAGGGHKMNKRYLAKVLANKHAEGNALTEWDRGQLRQLGIDL